VKFIQLHKQALKSSAFISLLLILIVILTTTFFKIDFNYLYFSILLFFLFISVYFVFKIHTQKFIYGLLKKMNKLTPFEDEFSLHENPLETDFELFLKKFQNFAQTKHLEIEKLHNIDGFRREFLGNVSHELKTPIFTAQGYLLTLLDDDFKDKTLRKKYLERANKSIDRLNFIVKDLDMISKLESNELGLNIKSFNLIELIQGVFDLLEMKAKKRDVELSFNKNYDIPILVNGDIKRIEQVIINLLVNSIKYGSINGKTTVSIEPYIHQKILVKISDNGEGIKEIHIPRLFERFYRVDQSRSREQGGSGLGLSIVKHIVEAHNETILVKSEYGKGSEFSFTLKKVE